MESKTFVIGDIHGAHIPLQQCLERCRFDYDHDTLITLGDICDGWPYVYECVEILLKIPASRRVDIRGNHDEWFNYWLNYNRHPDMWMQGGKGTARSYLRLIGNENAVFPITDIWGYDEDTRFYSALSPNDIPETHKEFFNNQLLYYKDSQNRLFVHGGFYRFQTLAEQSRSHQHVFYWDRDLWHEALSVHKNERLNFKEEFSEIFIGHTATTYWTKGERVHGRIIVPGGDPLTAPMHADIIYNLDTGAGSNGVLTIMDIDTHEFWQSDQVNEIYGEYKPRS